VLLAIAGHLKVSVDEVLGFRVKTKDQPIVSRRLMRRVIKIERLSRVDQNALLRAIDAFPYQFGIKTMAPPPLDIKSSVAHSTVQTVATYKVARVVDMIPETRNRCWNS